MNGRPRVSIGLPVYNGATYLAASIESVLSQTYGDLELIISDNASEDDTEEICRDFAGRDERVIYHRREKNQGASANYNLVQQMSRGDFFRWQADDDVMLPTCIERSVAALDAHPEAVLCHTRVRRIGPDGEELGVFDYPLSGTTSTRQSDRLRAMILVWHDCAAIFGLMRRKVLAGTMLFGPFSGTDRALLAELALCGRFVLLNEVLFLNRDHPKRFTRAAWRDYDKERQYHAPLETRHVPPTLSVFQAYFAAVGKHVAGAAERLRCYSAIAQAMGVDYNRRALVKDVLFAINPALLEFVSASKRRLAGASPHRR